MFIFLERDTFEARSLATGAQTRWAQMGDPEKVPIRRPYRGVQIKDDTYAVLSVRHPDGTAIPLASSSAVHSREKYDPGAGLVDEYSDFILQQVNDQRMEKQQIIETFGDTFVYFFGERPRMLTFSGLLMNTEDFNWRAQFWENYEKHFRGSRLVQANARCYLAYDTIVIEGYPLSAVAVDDATNPYQVSFQMTMLMTDYHEYSTIGETRFPGGAGAEALNVLNQELEESQKKFVSTTAEVRRANLAGEAPVNSALAFLRSGISSMNSAAPMLGDKLQTFNNLLGGRVMRVPIGAASYLQMAAEGEIASASIVTSDMVRFDTQTGERFGAITVNGVTIPGNKLLIMGPSKFAPSWFSRVNGNSHGFIHENYDEYPVRDAPSSLSELLTPSQYGELQARGAAHIAKMTAFQQSLVLYNTFAEQGGVLGTVPVVSSVRQGYGMLLTRSANVLHDLAGTATSMLEGTPQTVKRVGEGLKDGAFVPGVSMFVGGAARNTWESWVGSMKNRYSSLGAVFGGWEYQSKDAADPDKKAYDAAYGDSDYTPLLKARSAEAAALIAAGLAAEEANTAATIEKTLDEIYGNTDSASYGENRKEQASLEEIYGQEGTIKKTTPTAEERSAMTEETYNGDAPPNDTDTSGITASDADSAPIDPVV